MNEPMDTTHKPSLPADVEAAIDAAAELALPAFQARCWTYGGWPPHQRIPSKADLVEALHEIVPNVIKFPGDAGNHMSSTGRFTVRREKTWKGDRLTISLDLSDIPHPQTDDNEDRKETEP